ncbi:MAG: histidinol-phosphatase [Clostridia bacterium]|nr:histidinol-phosphatase [Clostridia bacterium]
MDYNFHTHTTRCGHATGSMEAYVLRAIEGGIRTMGFSDHIPLRFADGSESAHRVPLAEVRDYYEEACFLREKYKDKIEIRIGFETEFYPALFQEMIKDAVAFGAEYLILGQHFLGEENCGGSAAIRPNASEADLVRYTSLLIEAAEYGVLTYIAHPDIFNFTGDPAIYAREVRRLCAYCRAKALPLEINFLGIRTKRNYPNEAFWRIAGELGVPVTFGNDAHSTADAYDPDSLAVAEDIVARCGLNYIGQPTLVDIRKFV